jgi:hypothetical protein
MNVSVPAMSEKDIADLEFALGLRVDFIALSFVRSPADIDLVHQVMDRVGGGRLPVIAKLEKPEAVDNLEAIVLAFDGDEIDQAVKAHPEGLTAVGRFAQAGQASGTLYVSGTSAAGQAKPVSPGQVER